MGHKRNENKIETLKNTSITAELIIKSLNIGGSYGLEVPVMYHFYGQEMIINCMKNKLKAIESDFDWNVWNEFLKKSQRLNFLQLFPILLKFVS